MALADGEVAAKQFEPARFADPALLALVQRVKVQRNAELSARYPQAAGNILTVRELVAPAGVRILNDPGQAVATVAPPMAEEAPVVAATATTAVAEPEVLTERKPKEGEEAPAADDKRPKRPERAEKTEK